ncbi:MAG: SPFH domain-containing protein [Candidatus Woesearchaeota archaeon]
MGIIQELEDLVNKFRFQDIVYEYQQGLYIVLGTAIERKRKITSEEEEKYRLLEEAVVEEKGSVAFLPFRRPELPPEYRRSWINGMPKHQGRYSKLLSPGMYFYLPGICTMVKDSTQMRVLDLGSITIMTTDNYPIPVGISCNLRYRLADLYKAYTAVHDYEDSLKIETLSRLAEASLGKSLNDWKAQSTIKGVESKVAESLRELVTNKWGLEILNVTLTDVTPTYTQRLVYSGQPVPIKLMNHEMEGN